MMNLQGRDRTTLIYPGNQSFLMETVAAAASLQNKPVIVVTMGGGPVDLSLAKSNSNISAIIWCGYPGMEVSCPESDAFLLTNADFILKNDGLCTEMMMRALNQGGAAIADAIFGVTNAFGRLTQTWYNVA